MSNQKVSSKNKTHSIGLAIAALVAWIIFTIGVLITILGIAASEAPDLGGRKPEALGDFAYILAPLTVLTLIFGLAYGLTLYGYSTDTGKKRKPTRSTLLAMGVFFIVGLVAIGGHAADIQKEKDQVAWINRLETYLQADYGGDANANLYPITYQSNSGEPVSVRGVSKTGYSLDPSDQITPPSGCGYITPNRSASVAMREELRSSDRDIDKKAFFDGFFSSSWSLPKDMQVSSEYINGKEFEIRHFINTPEGGNVCPSSDVYYATYADSVKFIILRQESVASSRSRADFIRFLETFKNL